MIEHVSKYNTELKHFGYPDTQHVNNSNADALRIQRTYEPMPNKLQQYLGQRECLHKCIRDVNQQCKPLYCWTPIGYFCGAYRY